MRIAFATIPFAGFVALGLLTAATPVRAQDDQIKDASGSKQPGLADKDVKPAIQQGQKNLGRMVIYNGPTRTVRYFMDNQWSRSDSTAARDLERAENELAQNDHLLSLRDNYVNAERALQAARLDAEKIRLSVTQKPITGIYPDQNYLVNTTYLANLATIGRLRRVGFPFLDSPYFDQNSLGDYSGGYGGLAAAALSGGAASMGNYGGQNDSAFQRELAHSLVSHTTADYRAGLRRNLADAQGRVGESKDLQSALGKADGHDSIAFAGYAAPAKTTVTLTMKKDGAKLKGQLVRDLSDSIVIDTGDEEMEIRKSEIAIIAKKKS